MIRSNIINTYWYIVIHWHGHNEQNDFIMSDHLTLRHCPGLTRANSSDHLQPAAPSSNASRARAAVTSLLARSLATVTCCGIKGIPWPWKELPCFRSSKLFETIRSSYLKYFEISKLSSHVPKSQHVPTGQVHDLGIPDCISSTISCASLTRSCSAASSARCLCSASLICMSASRRTWSKSDKYDEIWSKYDQIWRGSLWINNYYQIFCQTIPIYNTVQSSR